MKEQPSPPVSPEWFIPLSAVNQYLYCPRRAALIHVEGIFEDNEHTIRGDIVHEHADLAGYEVVKGVTLLRALPVFSERLGLSGKCDIVEVELGPTANLKSEMPNFKSIRPVEFKLGKRRQFENDDAQVCAQALCLEEMFGLQIERGAIYHAASKRRREVVFTPELRALTEQAVADLRAMLAAGTVPAAQFEPRCEECSLYKVCLPQLTGAARRRERLQAELFQI
jgi:CRISPR-associated exonuclease Cas4